MSSLDDHALAARVASATGELLVELLEGPDPDHGGWSSLEYRGDRSAHEFIVRQLREHRPEDAVLSEEGRDDRSRLDADRVWIVDPLDGSSDFGWSDHWSVHVGLVQEGRPVAGAVAVPGWDTTWATEPTPEPIMSRYGARPRVVVARSRRHIDGRRLQEGLGADVMAVGSAGVKAMAVVRGEVDAYVHGGGLYEWDSCAPVAVALAAGLAACALDGAALEFNKSDPWSPGLIICRPELLDAIVSVMH
ncbi:MAG: 3'(2'),5'-bisphosphate nucleotidase CysQ [Actinobacteria bacterium]|nr:3'(2'),5'-bisphosphate nucleotidase CysQ [Actinomycetota bacterium]NIS32227.1 3'(2'),5'-bisphosphate nucleotidase CysQ [Actinomycetota bacterium]NIT96149.1 3'(2'),5'-bisphosphate nucleotidase CysQ [Actinomycetota bacterium]NIU19835.1 3'(2'),5'-bisphosphate nucleotidase CysQ [Actinomycetota bacterium]NIU67275.1 3'(2'),5'-bisphosphate nucleotidase CysQ [Actinomycetota bacterium]